MRAGKMFRLLFYRTLYSQSSASVTMGSIAAVLKENGYSYTLTKLIKGDQKNGIRICQRYTDYPIIISKLNFQDYEEHISLLLYAKKQGIARRIFLCGPFATLNQEQIMTRYPEIDGIMMGYCEKVMIMLAESLCNSPLYCWDTTIPGGVWRDPISNAVVYNQVVQNYCLNNIPLPVRDIEQEESDKIANLEFTRGCSNNCSFCHMAALKKFNYPEKVDIRDCEQVIQDIKNLVRLNKQFLIFNDSLFYRGTEDDERIIHFCNRLIEEDLNVYFMIYLSLQQFPPFHIMQKLNQAGLVRVFLGVENNEPEVLEVFYKHPMVNFESVVTNVLNVLHISYHIGYIVFYPGVTIEQLRSNIYYLIHIGKIHRIGVLLEKLRIIPNTKLFEGHILLSDQIDSAYNYTFPDQKVTAIFSGIRIMFIEILNGWYAKAEVMCTSYDLMMAYCYRIDSQYEDSLSSEICYHQCNIQHYQEILSAYFLKVLDGVTSQGWEEKEVCSTEIHNTFIQSFYESYYNLQISWGALIAAIQRTYEIDIYKLIFNGDE